MLEQRAAIRCSHEIRGTEGLVKKDVCSAIRGLVDTDPNGSRIEINGDLRLRVRETFVARTSRREVL